MKNILQAKRIYVQTGSFAVSSMRTGINRNTLKTWARRYNWRIQIVEEVKPEAKPKGEWKQSLHHGQAHFILDGKSACSGGSNGAIITAGDRWFPWDGCVRKCNRCMPHAT